MRSYRNLPLRHKLTLLSLITATVAILLSCASFVAYELLTFKQNLMGDAAAAAEMVGYNSASALSFNDAKSAEETLQALSAQSDIIAACIYDKDGRVFATYPRAQPAAAFGPRVPGAVERFGSHQLELSRPIRVEGEEVGGIYIRSDFRKIRERLRRLAWIIGAVVVITMLVAYSLASRLQRLISVPVFDLAAIVGRVAAENDFSIRAAKRGDDELGRLIDGFNEMLSQIQGRDRALQAAHDTLERRVAERTASLAEASGLLEAMLTNSPDMIYFKDRESRFVRFSQALLVRYRDACQGVLKGKTDFDLFTGEHAEAAFADEQEIMHSGQAILARIEKETHSDGHVTWALTTKMPWRDGSGAIVGTFGISKDVTALKEIEGRLAYERDQLRALLDSSPDTIYFKDTQSRFTLVSRSKVQAAIACVPDLRARRTARGLPAEVPEAELLTGLTDFDTFNADAARVAFEDEQNIVRTGEPLIGKLEKNAFMDGTVRWALSSKMPWRDREGKIIGTFGVSKDISDLKGAEAKLEETHRRLLQTSRLAGMAEVATGVLHNVGNVLNSVNVSATLVADHVRHTKAVNVAKVATLLAQHQSDLAEFLTTDPRGKMLPDYLGTLADSLAAEHKAMIEELDHLRKNIEHIKDIVSMQRAYARTSGVTETVSVPDLIEDAIRINAGSLSRHAIETVCDFQARPTITTDKHKVMQILINLVGNAKHACDESGRTDKKITVRTTRDELNVKIAVSDNGIGIPAENLTRIFNHGFTTRKDGHGFGLHSGALAAKELGGSLTAHSAGPGLGATFVLTLPLTVAGNVPKGTSSP